MKAPVWPSQLRLCACPAGATEMRNSVSSPQPQLARCANEAWRVKYLSTCQIDMSNPPNHYHLRKHFSFHERKLRLAVRIYHCYQQERAGSFSAAGWKVRRHPDMDVEGMTKSSRHRRTQRVGGGPANSPLRASPLVLRGSGEF